MNQFNFKNYLRQALKEQVQNDLMSFHPGHAPGKGPTDWGPKEHWPGGSPKLPHDGGDEDNPPEGWPFDQPIDDETGCLLAEDPNCVNQPPGVSAPPGTSWRCVDGRCGFYDANDNWWVWNAPRWHYDHEACSDPGCPGRWVPQGHFITPEGYLYFPGNSNPYSDGWRDGEYWRDPVTGHYWWGGRWHIDPPPYPSGPLDGQGGPPGGCAPPGGPSGDCTVPDNPDGTPNDGEWPDDWPPNNDQYWCDDCVPPGWTDCPEGYPGCGLP